MIRWLASTFAWRLVRICGVWAYWQNDFTGAREAVWLGGPFGPVAHDWLAGGEFSEGAPSNPPNCGAAGRGPTRSALSEAEATSRPLRALETA